MYRRSCTGENHFTKVFPTHSHSSSPATEIAWSTASKSHPWTRRTRSCMSEPTFSGLLPRERRGIATVLSTMRAGTVAIGALASAMTSRSSTTLSLVHSLVARAMRRASAKARSLGSLGNETLAASVITSMTTVVPPWSSWSLAASRRSAPSSVTRTSTRDVWSLLNVSRSLVRRWTCVMRTLTAKPPTTDHWGSDGKRVNASTNDRIRPPRSLTRMMASPGTHDPFGLPLLEDFEAARTVLGNVESHDDVVGHRPTLPRCARLVDTSEAGEPNWCHSNGAGADRGVECVPENRPCSAKYRLGRHVEVGRMVAACDDRHTPRRSSEGVRESPSHRVLGLVEAEPEPHCVSGTSVGHGC